MVNKRRTRKSSRGDSNVKYNRKKRKTRRYNKKRNNTYKKRIQRGGGLTPELLGANPTIAELSRDGWVFSSDIKKPTFGDAPAAGTHQESWKLLFLLSYTFLGSKRIYKHLSDQGQVYFKDDSASASIDFVICEKVKHVDLNICDRLAKKENERVSMADGAQHDIDVCVLYVKSEGGLERFPIYIQDEHSQNEFIDSINRISQPPTVCPLDGLKFKTAGEKESKIEGLSGNENQLILKDDGLQMELPPFPSVSFHFSELEDCAGSVDKKGLRLILRESKKVSFFPDIIDVKLKLKDIDIFTKLFMVERASQLHDLTVRALAEEAEAEQGDPVGSL